MIRSLARFLVVGGASYLLSIAFIAFCVEVLHLHYAVSMVVGYFFIVCIAHFLNRRFSFSSDGRYLQELGKYHLVSLTQFVVGLALMTFFIEFVGFHYVIANAFAALAVALASFFMHRAWTFSASASRGPSRAGVHEAPGPATVVQVASYFPTHTGGLEIVAWNLAQLVAQNGYVVRFFACGERPPGEIADQLEVHSAGFVDPLDKRIGIPMPIWSLRSLRRLRRAIASCNLVHVHETLYFGSVAAVFLAVFYGRPLVLTMHTSEPNFSHRAGRWSFRIAYRLVSRPIMKAADRIVFVGRTARDFHAARVDVKGKIAVIPNGVDPSLFPVLSPGQRIQTRLALGLPTDRPVFLYVGRMIEAKGVPQLLSVAAALPGVEWVFVGEGPINPKKSALGNVRVLGRLEQADVARYYGAADLVVSPGIGEGGVTLVVQEAMACGAPVVISTEVAAALDPPIPAGVFVFDPTQGGGLLNVLSRLAARPAILDPLRESAAKYAERWNWKATALAYQAIYEATLGDTGDCAVRAADSASS